MYRWPRHTRSNQYIVISSTPVPHPEPALSNATPGEAVFDHYDFDVIGTADTVEKFVQFLREHYFCRLAWAILTLNPFKCSFFVSKLF